MPFTVLYVYSLLEIREVGHMITKSTNVTELRKKSSDMLDDITVVREIRYMAIKR